MRLLFCGIFFLANLCWSSLRNNLNSIKLCFDARMARASGIGTYIGGLLAGLAQRVPSNYTLTLITKKGDVFEQRWPEIPVTTRIYSLGEQVVVPWAYLRSKSDLLHVPHYNLPIVMADHCVVTIHDLIHLKFPQFWPSKIARAYAHFFFHRVVPRARAILADSESTKRDLMEMLSIPGDRISVIYLGVWHDRYQTLTPGALLEFQKLKLPHDYLLYVGNLKEFKNVERLLEAYNRAKASH